MGFFIEWKSRGNYCLGESMPEIHNVFILKDGIPIFHVNPVRKLIQKDHQVECKTKEMDSALVAGFLSAIASFANEIGIGTPVAYKTEIMDFSFLSQNDLLLILGSTDVQETDVKSILIQISDSFVEMVLRDNLHLTSSDLSPFNQVVKEILSGYLLKFDLMQESQLIEEYAELVPQSHIVPEALERLSEARRVLFKLINGSNSIFEIAQVTNQDPRNLLSVLRSYTKSGFVSIQKHKSSRVRKA